MPESNDAPRRAYLKEHNVEKVLLTAIAKILKERPEDPIAALGKALSKPKAGFDGAAMNARMLATFSAAE